MTTFDVQFLCLFLPLLVATCWALRALQNTHTKHTHTEEKK
tara:strand:+ start:1275 stop:1397 length:123 start_codon:yes stop_codon:yes gene_type:complete